MKLIDVSKRAAEILLIEDNIGDVYLTKEAFKSVHFKYNLHIAKNGEQALQMLRRDGKFNNCPKPDLILLDLNLPKVDGREVLDNIKSDTSLRDIPVIVLSGSKSESDITTSYNLHANSYVVKPDNFEDYMEIVTSIENFWFDLRGQEASDKTIH